tara:strand:- start:8187 stop:9317 length:1131 start_codon:yes stop_codon:yes gene_type:complete
MKNIYLDNAATTEIDIEVIDVMVKTMRNNFGNPSSIHSEGRKTRSLIEESRKKIADLLNSSPSEIFFTSGGTEADNMAIRGAVRDAGVRHIITSKIEHAAVINTVVNLENKKKVTTSFVKLNEDGEIDLENLEYLLSNNSNALVSLMHGNNEIGNLLDIEKVSLLCKKYGALFHSDTVQTIGHYNFDLSKTKIDFLACSAHKFHGPKGVGFLYINKNVDITPLIHGGSQERDMRAGTECVYGIVGLAKAMEVAYRDLENHRNHIETLKRHMINKINKSLPMIKFNGKSLSLKKSLYTILSIQLPPQEFGDLLTFNLDLMGVSCSGGSACSSGSISQSHVITELKKIKGPVIRFSFSKNNSIDEIDLAIEKLNDLLA